jgi:hypothetical protein
MAAPTLLDVAKLNNTDKVVGLIEEAVPYVPEAQVFPTRTIRGTSYYTVKRTSLPSASFRSANAGVTVQSPTFEKQLVQTYILTAPIEIDLSVAQAYEDGQEAFEMQIAAGQVRGAMVTLAKQIWTGSDQKGFPGIKSLTPKNGDTTVTGPGTTSGSQTSVYAVKFGLQDVTLLLGNGGVIEMPPFQDQLLTDANGNKYPGRVSALNAWVGLQVGNVNCVGRICNIEIGDDSKGLNDKLLSKLVEKFPVGFRPDAFFMHRFAAGQLWRSRTVTLFGGPGRTRADVPTIAPFPTEFEGIPIYVTDAIPIDDPVE